MSSIGYSLLAAMSQDDQNAAAGGAAAIVGVIFFLVFMAIYVAIFLAIVIGMWKTFVKAGQPGWAAIIPFYNTYVMTQFTGKPAWWVVGIALIPIYGIILAIQLIVAVAESFGKGVGFALGLIFLPFIFWPMLGFGKATFRGLPSPQPGFAVGAPRY